MSHIRLLSFNIHGGRALDGSDTIGRVHELMERLDIDIGVFQEVDCRPSRGREEADIDRLAGVSRPHRFAGITLQEEGGWYGNLIASRYPILRGVAHNLETGADLEPRNAVDAVVETPYNSLRVIGTHLSLSYLERRSEAHNLLRLMRAVEDEALYPLLLMGDVNEWQWPSELLRFLDGAMTPLPCKATFPAFLPIFKLDRVWHDVPSHVRARAHRIAVSGMRFISDHLPLLVEVDFRQIRL